MIFGSLTVAQNLDKIGLSAFIADVALEAGTFWVFLIYLLFSKVDRLHKYSMPLLGFIAGSLVSG
ncbi:MAG: hypothetical protein FWC03_12330 [Treponema sp.]|nr:hypothetical protein [Treponema sp.]